MNIRLFLRIIICGICLPLAACGQGYRLTTNVTVIGSDGLPVDGADVHIGYPSHQPSHIRGQHKTGSTDKQGQFSFTGTAYWKVSVKVSKEGYYDSLISSDPTEVSQQDKFGSERKIDTTVSLREIRDPVPMYARLLQIRAPKTDQKLGFDFLINDWVSPFGKGMTSHVFVTLTGIATEKGIRHFMKWEFANENDGILRVDPVKGGSQFDWPYLAPKSGYNQIIQWQYTRPDALAFNNDDSSIQNAYETAHWIIRFNTRVNENDEIIHANYGKFYGSLFINGLADQSGYPGFSIQDGVIYVNPKENERSLEFQTEQNLASESLPPAALLIP